MSGTPNSIETSYINAFRSGFEHAFQQQESLLTPFVETVSQNAEFQYYDRLGVADDMQEDVQRYGENPMSEIEHGRRRIDLRDFDWGKAIEPKDLKRIASDPTNEYTRAGVWAANRKKDDLIVEGVFDPVQTDKKGNTMIEWVDDGGTSYSKKVKVGEVSRGQRNPVTTSGDYVLQSGNYEGISVDGAVGNDDTADDVGLNLAKLKLLKKAFMRVEAIRQTDMINLFLTTEQWDDLLSIDAVINSDYAIKKRLESGEVTTWFGYRFIPFEGLPLDADGNRRCIALASNNVEGRYGIKAAVQTPLTVDMWRLPSRKNIPYIYIKMGMRAVRFWGELVAEIKCAE